MTDFETDPVGTLAELAKVKEERDAALEQVTYWRERALGAEREREERARLKAQWQAEAVSEYAFHYLGGHEQELAEIYAGKLRRQAEGAAAYHAGLGISDNPYLSDASPQPTEATHAWQRGYEAAAKGSSHDDD